MEPKYVEAIKAGIIGGVILAALQVVNTALTLLNVVNVDKFSTDPNAAINGGLGLGIAAIGCCLCLLYILVLGGTGALAVRMTRMMLRDLNDAIITSALAGAVAGIIWGVIAAILSMLQSLVKPDYSGALSGVGGSLFAGVCGIICCLPIGLVIGIILAIVGGAIYYSLAPKQ